MNFTTEADLTKRNDTYAIVIEGVGLLNCDGMPYAVWGGSPMYMDYPTARFVWACIHHWWRDEIPRDFNPIGTMTKCFKGPEMQNFKLVKLPDRYPTAEDIRKWRWVNGVIDDNGDWIEK